MVSLHQKFRWENFHPTGIVDVAASPLNNTLVSCGLDGKLVFFDLKTGRECHSMLMEMAMRPTRLLWRSPSELVVGCVNGMLAVLTVTVGGKTVEVGPPEYLPHLFPSAISHIANDLETRGLVIGYADTVERWVPSPDWKPVGAINAERQPQGGPDDAVIGVWTISPSHFLVGFQAQGFFFWNPEAQEENNYVRKAVGVIHEDIVSAAMCHTSSALVVARSDSIDLYNLIGGDRFALAQSWNNLPDEAPVERIPIPVAFVRLDPPSAIVVSGGHDGGLCTRSALGRHEQPVFVGEDDQIYDMKVMAVDADGAEWLLTSSKDTVFHYGCRPSARLRIIVFPDETAPPPSSLTDAIMHIVRGRQVWRGIKQRVSNLTIWWRPMLPFSGLHNALKRIFHWRPKFRMSLRQLVITLLVLVFCWLLYTPPEGKEPRIKRAGKIAEAVSTFGNGFFVTSPPLSTAKPTGAKLYAVAVYMLFRFLLQGLFSIIWVVVGGVGGLLSWCLLAVWDIITGVLRGIGQTTGMAGGLISDMHLAGQAWACRFSQYDDCGYLQETPATTSTLLSPQPLPSDITEALTLA